MRRASGPAKAAPSGFTLVELLVVMMIIVLLVGLLVPAVTQAFVLVQRMQTRHTIAQIETALAAFYKDWHAYPPSNNKNKTQIPESQEKGYMNLTHFLMGPEGRGWGAPAGGKAPFGTAGAGTWGPYYSSEDIAGAGGYVSDSFRPGKSIFYYRAEPTALNVFDVTDNPTDSTGPSDLGFRDQAHFDLLVKRTDPAGKTRWVHPGYVLVSAGADRFYGHVKEDPASDSWLPATKNDAERKCDDVTNFEY